MNERVMREFIGEFLPKIRFFGCEKISKFNIFACLKKLNILFLNMLRVKNLSGQG